MEFKNFLSTKLTQPKNTSIWQKVLNKDDLAFASLTFGDLIYDAVRIDPLIVEAIDFSRAAELNSIPACADFAAEIMSKSDRVFAANIAQMKGYVAEKYVAETLRHQGAEVEFPSTSNQAGYDLLVNGDPFQVKCWETIDGVERHFEKYPDIPVFVNEELAPSYENNEMAYPVWGVRNDIVEQDTVFTISTASEVLDFEIPLFSAAIVAAKNVYGIATQRTDFEHALVNVVEGTAVRTAGAGSGAVAASLSLAAVGVTGGWATIILPMMGAIGGQSISRQLHERVIGDIMYKKDKRNLKDALHQYLSSLLTKINWMKFRSNEQETKVSDLLCHDDNIGSILLNDWSRRFNEERDFRSLYAQKIRYAIDHDCIFDNTSNLLESAVEAIRVTAHVGVLPQNLRTERRVLMESSSTYLDKIQKKIV